MRAGRSSIFRRSASLDAASAPPAEYPGWMVEFQNARDPRGVARTPTEAEIRAAADRAK